MTAVARLAAEPSPRASVGETIAGAGLLALAGVAGMTYVTLAVALGGFVIAFGLPAVMGVTNHARSTFVLALTTLLAAAAVLVVQDGRELRLLAVAVAVSVIVMFLVQLTRADNRPQLSACLVGDALGIGVISAGISLAPLARPGSGTYPVTVAMAAIALSCLLDPLATRQHEQGWLFVVVLLAGAVGALAVTVLSPEASPAGTAVLIGAVSAGLAHAIRRLLAEQAAAGGRGGLTVAAAGLLAPGLAVFAIARILG